MQTNLFGDYLTEEKMLIEQRKLYYKDFRRELRLLEFRRLQLVKSYKTAVLEIDEKIRQIRRQNKKMSSEL